MQGAFVFFFASSVSAKGEIRAESNLKSTEERKEEATREKTVPKQRIESVLGAPS